MCGLVYRRKHRDRHRCGLGLGLRVCSFRGCGGREREDHRKEGEVKKTCAELSVLIASVFEAELQDVIPICHATIAGTRIVGRLTAGWVFITLLRYLQLISLPFPISIF